MNRKLCQQTVLRLSLCLWVTASAVCQLLSKPLGDPPHARTGHASPRRLCVGLGCQLTRWLSQSLSGSDARRSFTPMTRP